MRLIDADELLRDAENYSPISAGLADEYDVKWLVDAQPTVDAVEVVHGHWISLTDCSNAGVYCSVCHKKVWKEDYAWCNRKNKLRSNYCPNCGASMRDGDGND